MARTLRRIPAVGVDGVDHSDSASVPLRGALGGQKDVHDLERQGLGEIAGPERQDVGVVVLPGVLRGCEVEGHAGADAGDLVGDHCRTDARAVHDDAPPGLPRGDRLCGGARENGMRYDSAYSDLGVRDAEITAHAEFRKRLYAYDVVPEAQAAAATLT